MPAANSSKCQVCSNPVRYDNPTYPFCRHHRNLKTMRSISSDIPEEDFDELREDLYDASKDLVDEERKESSEDVQTEKEIYDQLKFSLPNLDDKIGNSIVQSYLNTTRDINMDNSQKALDNREEILSDMEKQLGSQGIKAHRIKCVGGTYAENESMTSTLDHEVLLVQGKTENDYAIIIDPATMAPLANKFEDKEELTNSTGSGVTNFGDGISVQSVGEFASYSTVKYDRLVDSSGATVWSNETTADKRESKLRKIKAQSKGYVKPPIKKYNYSNQSQKKFKDVVNKKPKLENNKNSKPSSGAAEEFSATNILKDLLGDDSNTDLTNTSQEKNTKGNSQSKSQAGNQETE